MRMRVWKWLRRIAGACLRLPPVSVKTAAFEIRGPTVGDVIRILRELHKRDAPRPARKLGGREKGKRSAHHSERPGSRP